MTNKSTGETAGGHRGLFNRLYLNDGSRLRKWLGRRRINSEYDENYLGDQGRSVFSEIGPPAGGAVNFLKQKFPEIDGETIRSTVVASEELRQIENTPRDKLEETYDNLGYPYIDTSHLAFKESTKEDVPGTVVFNTGALDYLRSLSANKSAGCPANNVMCTSGEERINVTREGWRDAASFIITAAATAA